MSYLTLKEITYKYKNEERAVIDKLELNVQAGEFIVVIGNSGCGKSTLLNLLAGLLHPDTGTIFMNGKALEGPGLERGIVFQHYSLFPWMNVEKNILVGVKQRFSSESKSELAKRVSHALAEVGLTGEEKKYPHQLSGGMRQRAALARAFAMDSEVLLLDEPFGALDPIRRRSLQQLLENIWLKAKQRKTVIFVTHDIDEAVLLADRIIFMENGRIAYIGNNDLPRSREIGMVTESIGFYEMRQSILQLFGSETEGAG